MVRINGELRDLAGKNIEMVVTEMNYDKARIAVEINGEIVPKAMYGQAVIEENDTVEVVSFVGGG